ncbi:hypothetical protein ACHMW6_18855 [Pseudoduganella sp. UC29_106]|uniref:hypothetical protein n=1 Tax=Pseudoduganella sp. UC29_106 TaxID=3374553 RepID=UPI003757AC5C
MDNIEREMTSVKRTVVISCITATLSTVFGVAAFNAALLSICNPHSSLAGSFQPCRPTFNARSAKPTVRLKPSGEGRGHKQGRDFNARTN